MSYWGIHKQKPESYLEGKQRRCSLFTEVQAGLPQTEARFLERIKPRRSRKSWVSFLFNLFLSPHSHVSLEVQYKATMHPSIYYFNQRESKGEVPGELQGKTNAVFLLIIVLTRRRQSWRWCQGGEPVQVLDNCQLCQWLEQWLLFTVPTSVSLLVYTCAPP